MRILGIAVLLVLTMFYLLNINFMWQNAIIYSKDASSSTGVFVDASKWLSSNLGAEDLILVPMSDVFSVVNSGINTRFVSYRSIWDSAGVVLQANTTDSEVLQVREYMIALLKEDPHVKYVVRDWVDPYATRLYKVKANDELMALIHEVKVIPFTLSTGWSSEVIIYQRMAFKEIYGTLLTAPPPQSFTIPAQTEINYTAEGTTLKKVDDSVGLYLPLEQPINSSKNHYISIEIRNNIEGTKLMFLFYYDMDGDGEFSGYDIDYVKTATLDDGQLLTGSERQTFYEIIPSCGDPVVQIALKFLGEKNGELILRNLRILEEINSD